MARPLERRAVASRNRPARRRTSRAWSGRTASALLAATALVTAAHAQEPDLATVDALLAAARWDAAASLAEELRAEIERSGDPLDLAAVLDRVAKGRTGTGRAMAADSLELARRALELRRENGGSRRLVAESLITLGSLHLARAELDLAIRALEQGVALLEEGQLGDTPLLALGLERLGTALLEAEDLEGAQLALERSFGMRARLYGDDHPTLAASLAARGDYLSRTGDVPAARLDLERALDIQERHLRPDDPRLATTLSILGRLDSRRGRYREAARHLERALAIQQQSLGAEHPEVARSYDLLARISFFTGDLERARERWQRSLELKERLMGAMHPEVATVLNNLASLGLQSGDYGEAQRLFERAARIYTSTLGPEHSFVASTHHNLARVHHKTGDYEIAREHFERALELKEKALGTDHPSLGPTLIGYASLLKDLQEDDAASRLYERALELYERTFGAEHPNVAAIANSLALSLGEAGDPEASESYFRQALGIYERTYGTDHPYVGRVLGNLADLYRDTDRPAQALALYEKALALERRLLGAQHPDVAELLTEKGILHYRTGDEARALDAGLEAERIGQDHVRLTILTLSERRALRYAAVRSAGLDLALTLAAEGRARERSVEIWQTLIDARTLVLDEMAARNRTAWAARREGTEAALEEVQQASEALARLLVDEIGGELDERRTEALHAAYRRRDRAERFLAESSAVFRRGRERASLALADIVAELPPGSAILAYARYRQLSPYPQEEPVAETGAARAAYVAFVLAPEVKTPSAVDLGPAASIDALVTRWWRESASSPAAAGLSDAEAIERYRQSGSALRAAIWDPVAGELRSARRVFVVADGLLHLVNLSALPSPAGGYLLEDGPILHLVSSERELVPLRVPPGQGLLAVGAPNFDVDVAEGPSPPAGAEKEPVLRGLVDGCRSLEELRFGALPGAGLEVESVLALWRQVAEGPILSLDGDAASEEAVKRLAPGRRVLHLATHGFFLGAGCPGAAAGTRGVGGLTPKRELGAAADPRDNPLLLSGLALAGANQRSDRTADEDDGILTAEELAILDLTGVEWAVLSACDTGLGPVTDGEGVFGLRRSLRIAGARTVILSLWSVEDQAARSFMESLYRARLRDRLDTSRAVQQASRELLAQRRATGASIHPFYWAGFVASGEWR